MNIFVAKMSSFTTANDLANLFGEHGTVLSTKVIVDKKTGHSKCYGFVEMKDEVEGLNAIDALHDTEFHGKKIVVKKAIPLEENEHTLRRRWIARAERKYHG